LLLLGSCFLSKNPELKSLTGEWNVVEITSDYKTFANEGGANVTSSIVNKGSLGSFNFTKDRVNYEFTRNDTLYTGNESWRLVTKMVNAGFIKVPEYTLYIDNKFHFNVRFGNSTKNSERNATRATFTGMESNNSSVEIGMKLEKKIR